MIQNCHQFEKHVQSLMDSQIDPETDQQLRAHADRCSGCADSLISFSLLYSNYLDDTESMVSKLGTLQNRPTRAARGQRDSNLSQTGYQSTRNLRRHRAIVFATSLAAMLALLISLAPNYPVSYTHLTLPTIYSV